MQLSARRALLWSFAERYASFAVALGSTLVLSRLLTPAQVGVYSLCAALSTTAAILRDFGVSEYLIQERDLTRDKIRAAFGVALVVAWVLGLAIFLGRNAVAGYFNEPVVAQVLAVTTLQFVILPITSPAFALLNRAMAFRRIFALQITCNLAAAGTSITLAWRGHGTMALAWGPVVNVAVQTVILIWLRPKGSFVLPGLRQVRSVLQFGWMYMTARLVETLSQNFHDPVIAKRLDFASVGLYSRAFGMVEMFRTNVTEAVVRVATPAFAAAHREGRPLVQAFAQSTAIFTSIAWPFFGFVALTSHDIVSLLFGQQWLAAAPIASILALAAIPVGLCEFVPQLLSVTGHVRRRLSLSLWISPLHMAGLLVASRWGLQAMAAVSVFSGLLLLGFSTVQLKKALRASARQLYGPCTDSAAVALASLAAQTTAWWMCQKLGAPAFATLAVVFIAGAGSWLAVSRGLQTPAFNEWLRLLRLAKQKFG